MTKKLLETGFFKWSAALSSWSWATPCSSSFRNAKAVSISPFQAGLTDTFFSLPAGIAIPIMGFLADKIGREKIIVPSLIIYGLGGIISRTGSIIFNKSFTILLTGRVIRNWCGWHGTHRHGSGQRHIFSAERARPRTLECQRPGQIISLF